MKKLLVVAILAIAVASPATAQMHGQGPTEVSLRVEAGRLLVPVKAADGTEFEFMLSTGTPPTVLSESTAAKLGGHLNLTIGGLPLDMEGLVTVPDEQLTTDGLVIAGIVGSETLNDYDILIDVPGERLVLKPFGRRVEWDGMKLSDPIRLRVLHGAILALDIELNGTPYMAQLDLGMSTLIINEPVQTALHLQAEGDTTLGVGGAVYPRLSTRMRDLEVFERWDPDGAGFVIVGAPLVFDCAVSISFVHQEMRTCVR